MGDQHITQERLPDDEAGFSESVRSQDPPSVNALVERVAALEADNERLRQERRACDDVGAESQRRLKEMTLLYRVSSLIASAVDMASALHLVCQELAVYLDVPQAGFALLNPERTAAEVIADVHPAETPSALGAQIPVADNPSMAYILAHQVPLAVSDAQADPRLLPVRSLMHERRVRSILLVPIMVERDVIGTLGFDAFEPHRFSTADVELVQHVANQAGQWLMRKRAEEALRSLKEFNEEIVRNAFEGIAIQDADGLFTFVNPAAAAMLGYAPEELIDQPATAVIPPEHWAEVQAADERRRRGESDRYRLELVRRDGTRLPVLVSGTPRFDSETGEFAGTLAVFTDVSQEVRAEEDLATRAREMLALHEISLEINAQPDVTALLNAVVQRATELLGVSKGRLYLMHPDGRSLELVVSHNLSLGYVGTGLVLGEDVSGRVAESGESLAIEDYAHWDGRSAAYSRELFRRVLAVPLKVGERVIGVLNVADDRETGLFNAEQVRLASMFADQAAIAVENARLLEAEHAAHTQAEALRQAGQVLGASLEVGETLRAILDQLRLVVACDTASVVTFGLDDSPGLFVGRGYADEAFTSHEVGRLLRDSPILRQMAQDLQPVVSPDVRQLEGWIWIPGAEHVRSWMGIPLVAPGSDRQGKKGRMIGALMVDHAQLGYYSQTDLVRAQALGQHAAQALENARLFEEMERLKAFNESIVQGVAEGILIEDKEGRITFVNPAMETMLGYASQHLVGQQWTAIVPDDEVDRVQAELAQRARGVTSRYETALLGAKGRRIPVVVSATPLFDGERFSGVLSAFSDITERVQAERQSEERRRYLEAVLGAAPDAIVTLDPAYRIVEWNAGAEALFGYAREDAIGQALDPLITRSDTLAEAEAFTRQVMGGTPLLPREIVRYTRAGDPVDLLAAGSPIVVGDDLIGIVGVYTDIRERKRAEAQRDASLAALRTVNRRLLMLSKCNEALSRAREEPELLYKICQIVSDVGGYRLAWVGWVEGDKVDIARPLACAGLGEPGLASGDRKAIATAIRAQSHRVARSRSPGDASLIALPLLSGDQCLGVLTVHADAPDAFEPDEVQTLSEIADNLSFGILALRARAEHRWAEEVTSRYAERLENLRRIDRAILEAQSPEAIARATLQRIEHLLPCQQASISVFGSEANRPTTVASRMGEAAVDLTSRFEELESTADFRRGKARVVTGVPGPRLPRLRAPGSDQPVTGSRPRVGRRRGAVGPGPQPLESGTARDGQPKHEEWETWADSLVSISEVVDPALVPPGMRSALYIPLIAQGELIGALYLASDRPGVFDAEHIEIGYEVAAPLAVAIQHARLNQQLARHADSLEETVAQRTRELKAERDRTQAILESLGEAVIVTDVDGKILYTNPATAALTGFAAEEVLGDDWPRLQGSGDATALFTKAQDVLEAGDAWRSETISRRKNDVLYDAAVTAAPLFDPDDPGRLIGSVWVQRDITPMKEAERFKDRFVSNVSHELRTPLSIMTLVAGNLERLYGRLDDAKRQEMIGSLREQVKVLNELVGDVLEISRIDSGRVSRERHNLDLALLAREEMDKQLPLAQRRSLTLVSTGLESLPVIGNAGQLRQVIRNLLNNAIKFTPEGGQITCEFEAGLADQEWEAGWPGSAGLSPGVWAAMRVVDTGVGISREDLPHIFERFYRVTSESDVPGTGLGLAIARDLVDLHGGHLAVSSTPGQGSIFAFYLPVEEGS